MAVFAIFPESLIRILYIPLIHTIIINNVNSCFIRGDCQWVVDLQDNSKRLCALKESVVHYGSAGAAWGQSVFRVKGQVSTERSVVIVLGSD